MRKCLKIVLLVLVPAIVSSQNTLLDSLHCTLSKASSDTIKMDACKRLGVYYDDVNLDSSQYYSEKGAMLAGQLKLNLDKAEILMNMAFPLAKMGNYPAALKVLMQASEITSDPANEKITWHLPKNKTPETYRVYIKCLTQLGFGLLYAYAGYHEKQIASYWEGIKLAESAKDTTAASLLYSDLSWAYMTDSKPDSAILFGNKAATYFSALPYEDHNRKFTGDVFNNLGSAYWRLGESGLAKQNFEKAIRVSEGLNNSRVAGDGYLGLAEIYHSLKNADSGLFYAKKALKVYEVVGNNSSKAASYKILSELYDEQKKEDSAFLYLKVATALNDSVNNEAKKKLQDYQVVRFNDLLHQQELEQQRIASQTKMKIYALITAIIVFMLLAVLLYRNNRTRKKANTILQTQKKEIEKQKEKVENTLSQLKSTQAQLIQNEKMASLGELTAGIAHEIQNPLNFVNNFSEVSTELVDEVNQEITKGNLEDAKEIANDLKQNLEKISHHGKRAGEIVKGMLQHSRTSTGQKEPTDINALCDEYLRLAYHGLRAKNKSFNAALKTEFDDSIGKINIVPQDIGRVLLNLFNNAFYAVNEKQEMKNGDYAPAVTVVTKKLNGEIEIKVKDNGNGIPEKIKDKIFQPFFTTKPTGSGTGLGLSLSYDIVKAHGGEIKVETKDGGGTDLIIQLPISQ